MDNSNLGKVRIMNRTQVMGLIFYANAKVILIVDALNNSSGAWMFALSLILSVIGIVLLFAGAKDE